MLLNVQVFNCGNLCCGIVAWHSLSNCYEDRIKDALGQNYAAHFSKTPFALKGGLPGTTARLTAWWLGKMPLLVGHVQCATDGIRVSSCGFWGLEHWPRWWTKEKLHRHWWHCCCNSWKHQILQIQSQKRKRKWQQFTRFQGHESVVKSLLERLKVVGFSFGLMGVTDLWVWSSQEICWNLLTSCWASQHPPAKLAHV